MSEILNKLEKLQTQTDELTEADSLAPRPIGRSALEYAAKPASRIKVLLISSFFGGFILTLLTLFFSPTISKKASPTQKIPQSSSNRPQDTTDRTPAMARATAPVGTHEPALLKVIDELTQAGKVDEAITRLEIETGNNPFLTRSLFSLAGLYQKKNKADRATSTLMRILQIEPKNPLAYNNIGVIQLRQKRFKEAASFLKKACDFAPQSPEPWLNLAITYEQSLQLAESVQTYEKYVQIMSSDEERAQRTSAEIKLLSAVKNRLLRLRAFSNTEKRVPASSDQESADSTETELSEDGAQLKTSKAHDTP